MKPPQLPGKPAAGLGQLLHSPKGKAVAVAAGLVAVVAFARRSSGSSTTSTNPGTQLTPGQGGYYDSTANDVAQTMGGQIQSLQSQLDALSGGASNPVAPGPAAGPPRPPVPRTSPSAHQLHVAHLEHVAGQTRAKAKTARRPVRGPRPPLDAHQQHVAHARHAARGRR